MIFLGIKINYIDTIERYRNYIDTIERYGNYIDTIERSRNSQAPGSPGVWNLCSLALTIYSSLPS
jgi:hypothetical protein